MCVSVVIPCFNAEPYLAKTIESVLRQSVAAEVIVVDDGSTDRSPEILESFGDRIRVFRHPGGKTHGPAASRNLGIANSKSRFLAFLDADDLWDRDKLLYEIRVLEQQPDVGVAVSGCRAIGTQDEYLYDFAEFPTVAERDLAEALLLDCFIQTPGQALFRRTALERVGGFDETLSTAEDHDLWIRLAEQTRFVFIPERRMSYRKHPGSISNARARAMWQTGFSVVAKAEERRHYGSVVRRRKAVLHFRLAECAWRDGAFAEAAYHTCHAVLRDPLRSFQTVVTEWILARPGTDATLQAASD